MATSGIRRIILGERLPTARAIHERLIKFLALPIFGSDAISSSAYAVEEVLLVLMLAGTIALAHAAEVAIAIAVLFTIVAISYRQTITAYPSGGGAYVVAKDNLGMYPGLIAAAALLTDYILTVAVSIASGTAAIMSAMPTLSDPHDRIRIAICLSLIIFITFANLRGVRESGKMFAAPTYLFIISVLIMMVFGLGRKLLGLPPAMVITPTHVTHATEALTLLLVVRAFASGCAALTGIEAISNAVPAFKPPEPKNAAVTLAWMVAVCVVLFSGIATLAEIYHIVPHQAGAETVLSMLGRTVMGKNFLYYMLQASTAAILVLAANTSYAGFPRLSSILARDGFAPRQLANLGDRLVFGNGIVLLGLCSCVLVVVFRGSTHRLIPLYAIGVFLSFTLSQAGMVRHWLKLRTGRWRVSAVVNGIGAIATAIVLIVVASVKFTHGAWIVLVVIPVLILIFLKINRHYVELGEALKFRLDNMPRMVRSAVLVLVPGVHRGVLPALLYAKSISDEPEAVYVELDPDDTPKLQEEWRKLRMSIPLTVVKSPWRMLTEPVIRYIRTVRRERHVDMVTVVIPEFTVTRWWHRLLHNQTGLLLKFALMFEPGVVVTNVRYHLDENQPPAKADIPAIRKGNE